MFRISSGKTYNTQSVLSFSKKQLEPVSNEIRKQVDKEVKKSEVKIISDFIETQCQKS